MPPRSKKPAEPAPEVTAEVVAEVVADDIVNEGEPAVDVVEETPADTAPVLGVPETEREAPASAPLEAPEVRPGRPEAEAPKQADNFELGGPIVPSDGPKSVLIDALTGEMPDPAAVFAKEFEHGRSMVCRIRLLENLYLPGLEEPMQRLVLAAGQRVDIDRADMLQKKLDAQAGIVPADDAPADEV